jgi:uncharacterized protein YegJ (DUF2314 family)
MRAQVETLLAISFSPEQYERGAMALGAGAALFFLISLFGKRKKASSAKPVERPRVMGPAVAGAAAPGERMEAPEETVVQIDEDDPRMAAAVLEAKKRLTEFTKAFAKARDGWQFSVKAPFSEKDSEESEYMWVHVSRVDFDAVHGTLLNDPEFVKSFKYDDVVRVPMDQIVDWVYSDGENPVGDFTAKVLDEAAQSAASASDAQPPSSSTQAAQNDSSGNS